MRCSTDPRDNLERGHRARARGGGRRARRSSACPSCFARSTSARPRTTRTSIWPSRSRAQHARRSRASPRRRTSSSSRRSSSGAPPGLYHNTAVVFDADGSDARPVPQDAHPRRSALLREVLLHAGRPRVPRVRHARAAASARWCAGISGTPRARGSRRCGRRRALLPDGHRLAPGREGGVRRGAGRRPGRRSSARTPSPTASTSRPSTASGLERPRPGDGAGIEFWGGSFVADPFGVVLTEASRTEEETLIVTCDRRHQETVRQHWPFLRDRRIDAYGDITRRFIDDA